MKTIFAGTTDFGFTALDVLKRDFGLALIITQPDRPVGRKKVMTSPPVKAWAALNGIDCIQPEKIADAADKLKAVGADVMVVAAYGQIVPKDILEIPAKGSINLHTSLLPKYRGASPIQAALMNGDRETGVTVMVMDEQLDHGPILAQSKISISDSDDYSSLHRKLSDAAGPLLAETLPKFLTSELTPQEQDHAAASIVKTINRDQARIDWTKTSREIYNLVRALNPEPGTWTTHHDKPLKIMAAEMAEDAPVELPGTVFQNGRDCLVRCGDYSLKLLRVQPDGGMPISGSDFGNGIQGQSQKILK